MTVTAAGNSSAQDEASKLKGQDSSSPGFALARLAEGTKEQVKESRVAESGHGVNPRKRISTCLSFDEISGASQ
jgi:hypothetical protein